MFTEIISDQKLLDKISSLGFEQPTEVQTQTVPVAVEGRDVMVQAQTGSGKTLAFLLPLLAKINLAGDTLKANTTFAIIIAPTRELAVQIEEVLGEISDDISAPVLIGGMDIEKQKRQMAKDCRVVVGTPGRILDFIKQRVLKLTNCSYFVLDEADEMLSMGFIEDIRAILSHLPNKRQGLMVSATITGRVEMLAHSFLTKPVRISCVDCDSEKPDIAHEYAEVAGDLMAKPKALCDFIETLRPRSAIVFCNTKSDTRLVEVLLRRRGFDARRINSDLNQSQRNKIMTKIKNEDLQILVATDIAARGIDIEQIDLVFNFNIHEQPESYVHRTGRTGRAGRSGRAISLVGPRDMGSFYHLRKVLDHEFTVLDLPSDEEVAGARLSHLHEILRASKIEFTERDQLVARKLLSDLGNIEEPTEELADIIAKLGRHAVEHFVDLEAKSLDEELDSERETERKEPPKKGRDNDKKGGRREREQSGERGQKRETKRHSDDNKPAEKRREKPTAEELENRNSAEKPREKPRAEKSDEQTKEPEEVRLYIGQGRTHGLTEQLFLKLTQEKTELHSKDLRKLTVREHYGFVDLFDKEAETLLNSMNGIEHNGHALPIERAALLSQQRRQANNRNRRDTRPSRRSRPRQ